MEKQCEICGSFFETNNRNRKYCDDCSAHTEARKREYSSAVENNKRRMYEPSKDKKTCDCCGQEYEIPSNLLSRLSCTDPKTGEECYFCSGACMNSWKRSHLTCRQCGKSLEGNPKYIPSKPSTQFCSDECKAIFRRNEAIRNGTLHYCEWCGKEFIRKDGIFCSNECFKTARKNGWKSKKKTIVMEEVDDTGIPVLRREKCAICGKDITVRYTLPLPQKFPLHTCSDECARKLRLKIKKK